MKHSIRAQRIVFENYKDLDLDPPLREELEFILGYLTGAELFAEDDYSRVPQEYTDRIYLLYVNLDDVEHQQSPAGSNC